MLGCFWCGCWSKRKKMQKMFDDGTEKLEDHLDIVKIVKSLKKLKILMENSFMTEDVKKQIKHSEKNLLYLSAESGEEREGLKPEILIPNMQGSGKNTSINPGDVEL